VTGNDADGAATDGAGEATDGADADGVDGEATSDGVDPEGDDAAVTVEAAEGDDVDRVADLWVDLAAGQRAHGARIGAEANRTAVRERLAHLAAAGDLLVARRTGGEVVGFVAVEVAAERYETDADRGVVTDLYVVPERRGRGSGAALLSAGEARLADRGVDVVALEALADNDAARRFYRRHGYDPHRVEFAKPVDEG